VYVRRWPGGEGFKHSSLFGRGDVNGRAEIRLLSLFPPSTLGKPLCAHTA